LSKKQLRNHIASYIAGWNKDPRHSSGPSPRPPSSEATAECLNASHMRCTSYRQHLNAAELRVVYHRLKPNEDLLLFVCNGAEVAHERRIKASNVVNVEVSQHCSVVNQDVENTNTRGRPIDLGKVQTHRVGCGCGKLTEDVREIAVALRSIHPWSSPLSARRFVRSRRSCHLFPSGLAWAEQFRACRITLIREMRRRLKSKK